MKLMDRIIIDKLKLFARKYLHYVSQLRVHYFYSEISKINRCDVLLFCHDVDRGLTLGGLAYSPLIDSIYEELTREKIKCQQISIPWSSLGLKKTVNGSLLFNRKYFIHLIRSKIFNSKSFDAYDLIFKKSKARFAIGVGLPSGLCLQAKRHGVTTIEILHCIGYAFIPWGWDKLNANELPSKVLVLDDISKVTFKPLETKGLSVIKVPHPWYRKIFNPSFVIPDEWSYTERHGNKNILVTLQWGYGGEEKELIGILNNGMFYEELEMLIKKRSDFFWHFRLHPAQMKGAMSNNAISFMRDFCSRYTNVVWEKTSAIPLSSVASVCDAHITMNSMSCYDVAMLGLPSLVLCPATRDDGVYKDFFIDLVEEGYVLKAKADVDFIENWLDNIERKEPRSLGIYDNDIWDNLISEFKASAGRYEL
jgi:hypothetical protein